MTTYAFVAPIVPGKLEDWKAFTREFSGERKTEYAASRKRAGITRETAFHQKTPNGDVAVIVIESSTDAAAALAKLFRSTDPFDRWFAERVQQIHGISGDELARMTPNMQHYEWRA